MAAHNHPTLSVLRACRECVDAFWAHQRRMEYLDTHGGSVADLLKRLKHDIEPAQEDMACGDSAPR